MNEFLDALQNHFSKENDERKVKRFYDALDKEPYSEAIRSYNLLQEIKDFASDYPDVDVEAFMAEFTELLGTGENDPLGKKREALDLTTAAGRNAFREAELEAMRKALTRIKKLEEEDIPQHHAAELEQPLEAPIAEINTPTAEEKIVAEEVVETAAEKTEKNKENAADAPVTAPQPGKTVATEEVTQATPETPSSDIEVTDVVEDKEPENAAPIENKAPTEQSSTEEVIHVAVTPNAAPQNTAEPATENNNEPTAEHTPAKEGVKAETANKTSPESQQADIAAEEKKNDDIPAAEKESEKERQPLGKRIKDLFTRNKEGKAKEPKDEKEKQDKAAKREARRERLKNVGKKLFGWVGNLKEKVQERKARKEAKKDANEEARTQENSSNVSTTSNEEKKESKRYSINTGVVHNSNITGTEPSGGIEYTRTTTQDSEKKGMLGLGKKIDKALGGKPHTLERGIGVMLDPNAVPVGSNFLYAKDEGGVVGDILGDLQSTSQMTLTISPQGKFAKKIGLKEINSFAGTYRVDAGQPIDAQRRYVLNGQMVGGGVGFDLGKHSFNTNIKFGAGGNFTGGGAFNIDGRYAYAIKTDLTAFAAGEYMKNGDNKITNIMAGTTIGHDGGNQYSFTTGYSAIRANDILYNNNILSVRADATFPLKNATLGTSIVGDMSKNPNDVQSKYINNPGVGLELQATEIGKKLKFDFNVGYEQRKQTGSTFEVGATMHFNGKQKTESTPDRQ